MCAGRRYDAAMFDQQIAIHYAAHIGFGLYVWYYISIVMIVVQVNNVQKDIVVSSSQPLGTNLTKANKYCESILLL